MKFTPLPLQGAFLIEPEPSADERGFFARTFCRMPASFDANAASSGSQHSSVRTTATCSLAAFETK